METLDERSARHEQMRAIQQLRKDNRRRRWTHSKLDRFRAEIEDFASHGASSKDIAKWLATHKRTKVHPSTIARRLSKWRT